MKMKEKELYALLIVVDQVFYKRFDILPVILYMSNIGGISQALFTHLKRRFSSGEECLKILMSFARECSIDDMIHALYICSCSDLAQRLQQQMCDVSYGLNRNDHIISVPGTRGTSCAAHLYYCQLKKYIDNSSFKDEKYFLEKQVNGLTMKIKNSALGSVEQLGFAEKLLVVHAVRLQVFKTNEERFSIIQEMRSDMSLTPFTNEAEALYNCQLGSTYALAGDFENARKTIDEAKAALFTTKPSFVLYYVYINEILANLAEYQKTPNDELKREILEKGNKCCCLVSDEEEACIKQWRRLFLTFMTGLLLGVGVDLHEIDQEVTQSDRELATSFLSEIDKQSDNMETRREMKYCYLRARLLQEQQTDIALLYARRAKVLSEENTFRTTERVHIEDHMTKLLGRVN